VLRYCGGMGGGRLGLLGGCGRLLLLLFRGRLLAGVDLAVWNLRLMLRGAGRRYCVVLSSFGLEIGSVGVEVRLRIR
jgi:hypothetical protein